MTEYRQLEHQMMEQLRQYLGTQSVQFEETAQAERRYLEGAARAEVDASRRELVIAHSRFQESSAQQHL